MALLSLQDVSISFGGEPLLDSVSLHVEQGDRACLVGRNGCGKSTLLRLLSGEIEPDEGVILRAPGVRVAYLPQEVPVGMTGCVQAIVESADPHHADMDHWEHENAAMQAMQRLGLDPDALFETLSGGMKRRVLLARALVSEPDILLLDEPTNHLDIAAIEWLENFLMRQGRTVLFVTHDRTFLRRLATRILDLDRGLLAGWDCGYDIFLLRKQQLLDDESAMWEKKGKRLSQEEVWIRKGIKARRTRDEGRVRALEALRAEFKKRRFEAGVSRVKIQTAEKSGTLVAKAEGMHFNYPGEAPIIRDLDLRILRGERVGIIGPNGAGKTTLLKLITGALKPTEGTLTLGTRLEVAYFDQLRTALDGEKTIVQNVANDGEFVEIGGQPRHVYSYLQDFLFTPARARTPVKVLSGGERNRLLLAMLFLQPCNLLIMDEPTNDLDMETLDLLEEQLQKTSQTLLLVSHDRAFLNNVVTSTLVFEGDGVVKAYAGGYDDWVEQRDLAIREEEAATPPPIVTSIAKPKGRRLNNKERQELKSIPAEIEALEAELKEIVVAQCDAGFYKRPTKEIAEVQARSTAIAHEIEHLIERWAILESLAATAQ